MAIGSGLAAAGGGRMLSSVTSWSMENTINTITYQASNTRGYAGKIGGLHSCTGSISGLGGIPPRPPGERFRFFGFLGPRTGQLDDVHGTVYSVYAIANNVSIDISYEMSTPISWTVAWQSDWQVPGDELQGFPAELGKGFWDCRAVCLCRRNRVCSSCPTWTWNRAKRSTSKT